MSDPYTIIGSLAVAYAVSKLTEKITGSETLGMVAGLAAGGWAGSAIAGYQAAGVAGTAAASGAAPGSALSVAGSAPIGGGMAAGAAGSPIAAQAATGTAGSVLPGAAASVAPSAAPAAAGTSFLGFSPDELLKVAAGGLSGMAEYRQNEKEREIYEDRQRLREEEFEEDKRRYNAQGAYGVTNTGRVVPINAGQQLKDMNQRLGYTPNTTMGTMTNINTIQRPEGGYVSGFGRHQKESQNA